LALKLEASKLEEHIFTVTFAKFELRTFKFV
jgi:hypothetical protein